MCAFCALSCPFVLFRAFSAFLCFCRRVFLGREGRPNSQQFSDDLLLSTQKEKRAVECRRIPTEVVPISPGYPSAKAQKSVKRQKRHGKARKGRERRRYVEKARTDASTSSRLQLMMDCVAGSIPRHRLAHSQRLGASRFPLSLQRCCGRWLSRQQRRCCLGALAC